MPNHDIWDELELTSTGEHLDEEMFEYLSAYVDGECSVKERRLVEAYLAESAAARELLADLRSQAAWTAEDLQNPPAWLHQAILDKVKRSRRFAWKPMVAWSLAGATVVVAAFLISPSGDLAPVSPKSLIASVVPPPDVLAPKLETLSNPKATTVDSPVADRRPPLVQTSRSVNEAAVKTVSLPEKTVAETGVMPDEIEARNLEQASDTNYAVVEYGGGRVEALRPDPFASSEGQPELGSPKANAPAPAVLPDAREKLRDKVRKMNQEKLEIDDEEKVSR